MSSSPLAGVPSGLRTVRSSCLDDTGIVGAAVDGFGRLDILINCAGVLPLRVPLGDCPEEVWTAVIETNLNGVFYCLQGIIPQLKARGRWREVESPAGRIPAVLPPACGPSSAGCR